MYRPVSTKLSCRMRQRGMGLPEILAAVLIGLIGMVVIMQVYAVSEERKRTTTETSDAQINGSIAVLTLQRAIQNAGFGLSTANNNMLGCNTRAYNSNRSTPDFTFLMAPVVITAGAAGAPDQISVIFGSSPTLVEGIPVIANAISGADLMLKNAAGVLLGDLVVTSEPGLDCSLTEVTGFDPAAVNNLKREPAVAYNYKDVTDTTVNAQAIYNKVGGSGVDYTPNATTFSLGRSPSAVIYGIGNDKLQSHTLIPYVLAQDANNDGTSDADVGDGIVQLKALYGKDVNGDGVAEVWDNILPLDAAGWIQVMGIRIAILARSGKFEKDAVSVDCDWPSFPNPPYPPANAPYWSGGCFAMTPAADGTDWHRYRYRVYESVVPLRNSIWSK
jgi:type IV pilus assembly protein PilW